MSKSSGRGEEPAAKQANALDHAAPIEGGQGEGQGQGQGQAQAQGQGQGQGALSGAPGAGASWREQLALDEPAPDLRQPSQEEIAQTVQKVERQLKKEQSLKGMYTGTSELLAHKSVEVRMMRVLLLMLLVLLLLLLLSLLFLRLKDIAEPESGVETWGAGGSDGSGGSLESFGDPTGGGGSSDESYGDL